MENPSIKIQNNGYELIHKFLKKITKFTKFSNLRKKTESFDLRVHSRVTCMRVIFQSNESEVKNGGRR